MAINLWDPFSFSGRRSVQPYRYGHPADPFEQMHRSLGLLDRFFDDAMHVQLRDHAAQLNINEQGDLSYKVDVSGFRPEELKVEMQGNEIMVSGEHKEQNQGESVHRQFVRRVVIPDGIKQDTIKCDLDENGRLSIRATREGQATHSIPIDFKKGQTELGH